MAVLKGVFATSVDQVYSVSRKLITLDSLKKALAQCGGGTSASDEHVIFKCGSLWLYRAGVNASRSASAALETLLPEGPNAIQGARRFFQSRDWKWDIHLLLIESVDEKRLKDILSERLGYPARVSVGNSKHSKEKVYFLCCDSATPRSMHWTISTTW